MARWYELGSGGRVAVSYLSEEPVDLARPEAGEGVEEERVRVRRVVASQEAHFVCETTRN